MAEDRDRGGRPIVLVGMMGAGKTIVGRLLAARLGLPFADSDAEVERATGLTVAELFERRGEAAFRDEEAAAMRRLIGRGAGIVAAGGGAFASDELRRRMLASAVTIWLDAGPDALEARVAGSARPLRMALSSLLEERRAAYSEAHVRIPADGPPEQVVEAILGALAEPAR